MTLPYTELEHAQWKQHVALLGAVSRRGQSKGMICSIYGPYQVFCLEAHHHSASIVATVKACSNSPLTAFQRFILSTIIKVNMMWL